MGVKTEFQSGDELCNRGLEAARAVRKMVDEEEGEEEEDVEVNAVVKWAVSAVTYSDEFSFYAKGVVDVVESSSAEPAIHRGNLPQQDRKFASPQQKPSATVQPGGPAAVTKPTSKISFPHVMTRGSVVGNKVYCKTSINNCFTWRRRISNGCSSLIGGTRSSCSSALLMNFYHERTSDTQSTTNGIAIPAEKTNNLNNDSNDASSSVSEAEEVFPISSRDPEQHGAKTGRSLPLQLVSPRLGAFLLGVAGAAGFQLLFPSVRLPLFEVLLLSHRKSRMRKRSPRGGEAGRVPKGWLRFPVNLALAISRPFFGSVFRRTMTAALFLLQLQVRKKIVQQSKTTSRFMPNLITAANSPEKDANSTVNPSPEIASLAVCKIDSEVEELPSRREPEGPTNLDIDEGRQNQESKEQGNEVLTERDFTDPSDDSQDIISDDGLSSSSESGQSFEQEEISDDGLSSCYSEQDINVTSEEEISAISSLSLQDLGNEGYNITDDTKTTNLQSISQTCDDDHINGLLISPTETCSSVFTSESSLASDLSTSSSECGSRDSFSGVLPGENSFLSHEFSLGDHQDETHFFSPSSSSNIVGEVETYPSVGDEVTDSWSNVPVASSPLGDDTLTPESRFVANDDCDREERSDPLHKGSLSVDIFVSRDEFQQPKDQKLKAITDVHSVENHPSFDGLPSSSGADSNSDSVLLVEEDVQVGVNSPSNVDIPLENRSPMMTVEKDDNSMDTQKTESEAKVCEDEHVELHDREIRMGTLSMHSDSVDERISRSNSTLVSTRECTRDCTVEEPCSSHERQESEAIMDNHNAMVDKEDEAISVAVAAPQISSSPSAEDQTRHPLFPLSEEFQSHDEIAPSPRQPFPSFDVNSNLAETPKKSMSSGNRSSDIPTIYTLSPRADLTALMPEELAPLTADGAWEIKVDGFEVVWTPFKKDLSFVFTSSDGESSEVDDDIDSCKSADGSQTGEDDVDEESNELRDQYGTRMMLLGTPENDDDLQAPNSVQNDHSKSDFDDVRSNRSSAMNQSEVGLRKEVGSANAEVQILTNKFEMTVNSKFIRTVSGPVNVRGREEMSFAGLKAVISGDSDDPPASPVQNSLIAHLRSLSHLRETPAAAASLQHQRSSSGLDSEQNPKKLELQRTKAGATVLVSSSEDSVFTTFSDGAAGTCSDTTLETDSRSEDSEASTSDSSSMGLHHFADHPTCVHLRKIRHSHGDQEYMEVAELLAEPWRDLVYWHGQCREGRPTLVVHIGKAVRQLPASDLKQFITVTISHAEYAELNFFKGTVKQINILMDLDGLGIFRLPPMHVLQSIGTILNRDYAGRGGWMFLINAPLMLGMVISTIQRLILRPSVSEGAVIDKGFLAGKKRILTLGGKYKTTLLNYFDEAMIPSSLGGTCSACSSDRSQSCHNNFDLLPH
ncbi:hypothetical protein R1sor_024431 [Riccia sorocarpa]|uniref:CRAL-TRIO domain-containing protein n=1 Tax=Riccia sorocarpa TaxID=122646 RepID=A0ABD3GTR1_9MARC